MSKKGDQGRSDSIPSGAPGDGDPSETRAFICTSQDTACCESGNENRS